MNNIVIIGVGGQGTLLASRVLGKIGLKKYSEVKVSEVHGMSQRGGSVVTYVRMGDKVPSPIIENGEADTVLAFEELEALRGLPFLKKGGRLLYNCQQIMPMPVVTGVAQYPQKAEITLKALGVRFTKVPALELALKAGTVKCVNTVMIGVLAASTDIPKSEWLEIIKGSVPPKTVDINIKAFELGYEAGA